VYWARLANVYQMANLPDASVQAAERAIDAAPGIIQYRINLAQLAAALGNDDLAAEQYDEAIRLDPHNKLIREEAATWRSSATP
jgi:tetratricopeptide (TPR) repeat protein